MTWDSDRIRKEIKQLKQQILNLESLLREEKRPGRRTELQIQIKSLKEERVRMAQYLERSR